MRRGARGGYRHSMQIWARDHNETQVERCREFFADSVMIPINLEPTNNT